MIKQPWLAAFLSLLLPGAGQIYAGRRTQGIAVILLCFCLFIAVVAFFVVFVRTDNDETSRQFLSFTIASGLLLSLLSLYSYFDAYRAAKRFNAVLNVSETTGLKKPWLAVFLSQIFPGIGQFYNRQVVKGMLFIVIAGSIIFLSQYIHYSLSLLAIPLYLYTLKDAFESAAKINGSSEKFLMRETKSVAIFVVVMIVLGTIPFGEIIKANIIEAFKTPSGSMLPTLAVGDHMLIAKSCRAKAAIRRGDVVVFKYPIDPDMNFVKRVIAVEGDVIESRDKTVFINGGKISERYVQHDDNSVRSSNPNCRYEPDLKEPNKEYCRDNYGPLTVPKGMIFVLGDNRDQSYDSRFWRFVPKENVIGKALKIYWSWDRRNSRIRWERIGKMIE